jgi:DNA-binding response OmpR family regulator
LNVGIFLAWGHSIFRAKEIPMQACAELREPYLPPEAALASRSLSVLLVPSELRLGQFLNVHLWRAGYHVRMAHNSVEASALILDCAPDVMVLDIDAPGMNCFEYLAGIRADREIPFFPVIYLTADMNAANCAHDLGAACVRKPVQPESLLATVALSAMILRPQPARRLHRVLN